MPPKIADPPKNVSLTQSAVCWCKKFNQSLNVCTESALNLHNCAGLALLGDQTGKNKNNYVSSIHHFSDLPDQASNLYAVIRNNSLNTNLAKLNGKQWTSIKVDMNLRVWADGCTVCSAPVPVSDFINNQLSLKQFGQCRPVQLSPARDCFDCHTVLCAALLSLWLELETHALCLPSPLKLLCNLPNLFANTNFPKPPLFFRLSKS